MGIIRTAFNALLRSRKGPPESLKDPGEWLHQWWSGGRQASSGVTVTHSTAMRATAVYACVRILSESVASLPLVLYRRTAENGKEKAFDHPLYGILHDSPNDDQTSFEFREMLQSHLALRGNAFAFIDYTQTRRIKGLIPMHPDRISVRRVNGGIVYEYRKLDNNVETFEPWEILHLKGLSDDGVWGLSPIDMAREAVGLSLAAEEFGGRFFSNNTHIGTFIEYPGKLKDLNRENIKEWLRNEYSGVTNAGKPFVLENGMKLNRLNMTAEDAQFLESRKFQLNEIARIFRVPPHMIGDLEKSSFSNIEQQAIDFVTHTVRPWLVRWEQRLSKSLLDPKSRQQYFFEFKLDGLLRGETKARQEALQIQRRNGIINADEWRALENMNPIGGEEGSKYWQDKAMTDEQQPEPQPANN